jgi:hypothetical protein
LDIDWIAVYGAILSTALAVAGLLRYFRAKPQERENEAKKLLRSVLGPVQDADNYGGVEAMLNLITKIKPLRDRIIGLNPTLQKVAPEVAKDLDNLLELMDESAGDHEYHSAEKFDARNETEPLLAKLRNEIEKWLSDHA